MKKSFLVNVLSAAAAFTEGEDRRSLQLCFVAAFENIQHSFINRIIQTMASDQLKKCVFLGRNFQH